MYGGREMDISKLHVPLMLIGSLLGAAGSWAVTRSQVEETVTQVAKLKENEVETRMHLQRLDLTLEEVQHSLGRIEHKLGTAR